MTAPKVGDRVRVVIEDVVVAVDGFRAEGPCIASTATLIARGGKPVTTSGGTE